LPPRSSSNDRTPSCNPPPSVRRPEARDVIRPRPAPRFAWRCARDARLRRQ
jgi:hypothetical protein